MEKYFYLLIIFLFLFSSCEETRQSTSQQTLKDFISSIKLGDTETAWKFLTREVQYYYTNEGSRSGLSGEREFDSEIKRIPAFKDEGNDYFILSADNDNEMIIKVQDTISYPIYFYDSKGFHKIKDTASLFRIYDAVTYRNEK
jgi:uncharacterized protein YcfL